MATRQPRISRSIVGFNADIRVTNNYIKTLCEPPIGTTNGLRLGWLQVDIDKWQDIEDRWVPLYILYSNKKGSRTTNIKDQLLLLIKEAVTYEREHHLYDCIAINPNATITDYNTFRIKRGTVLADLHHTHASEPNNKTVSIILKKQGHLFHQLLIKAVNHLGRAKEEGVKEIIVYKAVIDASLPEPTLDKFQYVGDVSRGLILITHKDADVGKRAWYYARIKNSVGELGSPSFLVGYIIS